MADSTAATTTPVGSGSGPLAAEPALALYRSMLVIRRTEEALARAHASRA